VCRDVCGVCGLCVCVCLVGSGWRGVIRGVSGAVCVWVNRVCVCVCVFVCACVSR